MVENHQEIKSINHELPKPIALNCWKHHLGFVRNVLAKQSNYSKSDTFLHEIVQFIGGSQFDYYLGTLDVNTLSNEVIDFLKSENAFSPKNYKEWLNSEGIDYRCISLSDGSNWTLRLGQGDDRYIHIHPSRHSKKTIRVKSSSLKTAYVFLFYYGLSDSEISIVKVNSVRNKFAKLPALRLTSPLAAISRILNLFAV